MALEGPILAATLRNIVIPTRTSTLFCNILFGLCDVPTVSNFTVPFPKSKPNRPYPAVSGRPPIKVVHISDVHVDLKYEVGSSYNCTVSINSHVPFSTLIVQKRKLCVAEHTSHPTPQA
jgi:sphingomyelin phosphodiesterase